MTVGAAIVWLITTGAFWFLSNLVSNAIEATVHHYGTRATAMVVAGTAIGALASAVGYSFFILTILIILQLRFVRRKMQASLGVKSWVATKYLLPALLLIAFATVASYAFSIETCDATGHSCKRVFFERLYTPPHLIPPTN
jgi:hypothetical protein